MPGRRLCRSCLSGSHRRILASQARICDLLPIWQQSLPLSQGIDRSCLSGNDLRRRCRGARFVDLASEAATDTSLPLRQEICDLLPHYGNSRCLSGKESANLASQAAAITSSPLRQEICDLLPLWQSSLPHRQGAATTRSRTATGPRRDRRGTASARQRPSPAARRPPRRNARCSAR